jgi:sec-independent protein translocase protein TatB
MEILGIGIPELLVIIVLALIVVGPERLPEMMVKIARFYQDFRSYTSNITNEFSSAIEDMKEEFKDVSDATSESFRSVNEQLKAAETGVDPSTPATAEAPESEAAAESADEGQPEAEPAGVSTLGVASLEEIRRRVLRSSNGAGTNGAASGVTHDGSPAGPRAEGE